MTNILNHNIPFQKYFEEISRIPHGSFNEKAIADYLEEFAGKNGLTCHRDELNNIIIKKDGTGAGKNAEPIILQAHSDMVCVKTPETVHDFEKDPIPMYLDGSKLRTHGTTLGADNGTGVATMLSLLEDNFDHPPLEMIFTVQEEVGMFGAKALDYSLLKAKRFISLDSGGENVSSVNAAGCETMSFDKKFAFEDKTGDFITISISGLAGGHSGSCIDTERGNAIKMTARILRTLAKCGFAYQLSSIEGGQATNSIPDTCKAVIFTTQKDEVCAKSKEIANEIKASLFEVDANCKIEVKASNETAKVISEAETKTFINYLSVMPNGRQHKSMTIKDFVTASINVAKIEMHGETIKVLISARGASEFILDELEDRVLLIGETFAFDGKVIERTPCWEYMQNSELRKTVAELMPKVMGKELIPEYAHGGLECGYFAKNIPGVDIYVIGCIGADVHTPNEWLDLDSADRVYDFIKALLTELTI